MTILTMEAIRVAVKTALAKDRSAKFEDACEAVALSLHISTDCVRRAFEVTVEEVKE